MFNRSSSGLESLEMHVVLDRAIDIARQVAATDITVLISGESGTGKEFFPKIIHQLKCTETWTLYCSKLWCHS